MTTESPETATQFSASRRRVMIAGGASVLAVAGLAACGSDDSATSDTPADSATDGGLATGDGGGAVTVTSLDAVPEGGSLNVEVSGLKLIVTRPASGDPKVFSSRCPHQGCTVAPNGTTDLLCPCHQSKFAIDTGAVEPGSQSATGLPAFEASVVDGNVVIASTNPGPAAN